MKTAFIPLAVSQIKAYRAERTVKDEFEDALKIALGTFMAYHGFRISAVIPEHWGFNVRFDISLSESQRLALLEGSSQEDKTEKHEAARQEIGHTVTAAEALAKGLL